MGDLDARPDCFPTHRDTVIGWRIRCLVRAGLDHARAEEIACDGAYDLHALLGLMDRGCPVGLALRILAPLDGDRPR
jgi:hypothetical protein